jgi:hypothetical protein
MSSPFKTKEFQDLQKVWNRKLEKSGFQDIERSDRVGKASGRLKTDALKNITQSYTAEQFAVKEEYYRLAGQFLHDYKFKSDNDRTIWRMHSEGISVRDIIRALKKKGVTAYKDLVHGTIKRLADEMKSYVRQS